MLANRPGVKSHLGCFPWGNIGKTHQKPIKNPLISGVKRHMWKSHGFFLPRKRDRCRKETLGTTSCFKLVPQSDQLTFQSCAEYFLLAMRVEGTPSLQPGLSYIDGIGFKCFISAQFFLSFESKILMFHPLTEVMILMPTSAPWIFASENCHPSCHQAIGISGI
jgi:hypothetical protein